MNEREEARDAVTATVIKFLDDRDYFESDYGYEAPAGYDKQMLIALEQGGE